MPRGEATEGRGSASFPFLWPPCSGFWSVSPQLELRGWEFTAQLIHSPTLHSFVYTLLVVKLVSWFSICGLLIQHSGRETCSAWACPGAWVAVACCSTYCVFTGCRWYLACCYGSGFLGSRCRGQKCVCYKFNGSAFKIPALVGSEGPEGESEPWHSHYWGLANFSGS